MTNSKRRSGDDRKNYETLKLWKWKSDALKVLKLRDSSPDVQFLQNIEALILQCNICLYLIVLSWNCQHSSA